MRYLIVMFEQAYARAAILDAYFRNTGTLMGPLHGLPISIKDMIFIRDTHTTLGLTSHLSHPVASRHSALVAALEHLGAVVPYVKTNVPQLLLSFECNNAVFGRTSNPYNPAYTSGGSSGGEGALIAMRGSAFGIGTDIGGSLRIPAGYCGIYSLKPCSIKGATWPTQGMASLGGGFEGLVAVAGPMAGSVGDLEMAWVEMGKVFSLEGVPGGDAVEYTIQKESLERQLGVADLPAMKPLDYASLRPFSIASKRGTPLRIGFYHTDGFVHTTPACYRAMEETLSALRKRYTEDEIELVPLKKEDVRAVEAMEIFVGLTSAAKYRHLTHPHLAPDALDPTLWVPVYVSRLPAVVRALIGFILLYVLGEKDFAKLGAAAGGKSSEEYFMWVKRREDFRKEWRERVWEGHGLDAIVAYAASDAFGTQGHTLTFPQTDPGVSGSTAQRRQETLTHVHFHGNVQRPRLPRSMSPCHPGRRGQGLSNACTRGGGGFRRGTQDLGSLEFGFRAVKV
jgi:amidase